ncbi:unnamed protein product, partial [Brassica oleracea]
IPLAPPRPVSSKVSTAQMLLGPVCFCINFLYIYCSPRETRQDPTQIFYLPKKGSETSSYKPRSFSSSFFVSSLFY